MKAGNDSALKNYLVAVTYTTQYMAKRPFGSKDFQFGDVGKKIDYMHLNPLQPHWLFKQLSCGV